MPTTPKYALRYPAATDPADVPADMGNLAIDAETAISAKAAGAVIVHFEYTVSVSVTATTGASAQGVANPGNFAYDGQPVLIEFYSPSLTTPAAASQFLIVTLWDANTELGRICQLVGVAATSSSAPGYGARRLTPTVGQHNYNVRTWVTGGTSASVGAGDGVAGNLMPGFLRVTKA